MSAPASPAFHERQLGGVRCLEAGVGEALVWLHEPGQLAISRAHELLADRFRILAFEGDPDQALADMGLEQFHVVGSGPAAKLALRLAIRSPRRVSTVVLESPRVLLEGDQELEVQLASLELPTLVLFGTVDSAIPPDHGGRYRALLPDCYYMLVYKAGGQIALDRPEAFAAVVGDFLERREAFVVSNRSEKLVL